MRVCTCNGLREEHLDDTDHTAPTHVPTLIGQSAIGEPNDLLKGIEELLARGEVVVLSQEEGVIAGLREVQGHP
jgi:hypothetical protein